MKTGSEESYPPTRGGVLGEFFQELDRRRVFRSALAYAAGAFVLLQVGEIVLPAFQAPEWTMRVLVLSAFLGFPPALCLAWVFDLTPEGLRRSAPQATGETGLAGAWAREARPATTTLPRVALLVVTLATAGAVWWWSVREALGTSATPSPEEEAGPVVAARQNFRTPLPFLAVLPLEVFGEDRRATLLAESLHEEVIAQVAQGPFVQVASRTSVSNLELEGKTLPVIAEELGVDLVLEGSVAQVGNRVRITFQLIQGPTDRHLWAKSWDGTLDDPLTFQREVARAVAQELNQRVRSAPDTPSRRGASPPPTPRGASAARLSRVS